MKPKNKLYQVVVEREYYHCAHLDIEATSLVVAKRKALEILKKNEVKLDSTSPIPFTDKVIECSNTTLTRCPNCDSLVEINYAPNTEQKCPLCKQKSRINKRGQMDWGSNWPS